MPTSYCDVDLTNKRPSLNCSKSIILGMLKMTSPFASNSGSSDFEGFSFLHLPQAYLWQIAPMYRYHPLKQAIWEAFHSLVMKTPPHGSSNLRTHEISKFMEGYLGSNHKISFLWPMPWFSNTDGYRCQRDQLLQGNLWWKHDWCEYHWHDQLVLSPSNHVHIICLYVSQCTKLLLRRPTDVPRRLQQLQFPSGKWCHAGIVTDLTRVMQRLNTTINFHTLEWLLTLSLNSSLQNIQVVNA